MKNIKRYIQKRAKLSAEYAGNNDEASYADFKMGVMVYWARKVVSNSAPKDVEKPVKRDGRKKSLDIFNGATAIESEKE